MIDLFPLPDPFELFRPMLSSFGGVDEVDRVRRGMWLHRTLPRPPVGCTPHEVAFRQNKLVLRAYTPSPTAPRGRLPVVVVPSLINRAYICDLEPDRSLVGGLAALGHPVYLVDWGVPGPEDAEVGVAEVLLDLLSRALQRVCRHAGSPQAHILGYCQGGTLSAMYAALRPARVASLVALNAPVLFKDGGRFREFVSHLDVDAAIDADRLVSTDVMGAAFKLLDPMGNWTKYLAIERIANSPRELGRALARERWLEENVPMTGTFAREFIRAAYQEDRLAAGTWQVRGEPVLLRNITCPVFVATCAKDFITPAAAATPLASLVGSRTTKIELLQSGHIGVVVGSFGPKVFYPMLDRWFREV